jgi:hypothetical protein
MRKLIVAIAILWVSLAFAQTGGTARPEPQAPKPEDSQTSQMPQAPQSLRTWKTWQSTLPPDGSEGGQTKRGRRRRERYAHYRDRACPTCGRAVNYNGCYNCSAPLETGCGSPCFPVDLDASPLDNVLLDVFGDPCPDCEVIRY